MKKTVRYILITAFTILITAGCHGYRSAVADNLQKKPGIGEPVYKNFIIMVPDGCSMSIETFARLFKGSGLNVDQINVGSVRTYSANSIITDSAAAATAIATGHKTESGFVGIGPDTKNLLPFYRSDSTPFYPLPTILEGAKQSGKSTGLVVTSVICHATPAGFSAHVPDRMMYDDIMEQIVYQDIDVVMGGGAGYLLPGNATYKTSHGVTWKGARRDSDNLINVITDRDYSFISSRDEFDKLDKEKVWGVFNDGDLAPDIDRDEFNPSQPSLAEMTEKAINILSKNEKGFFLVVEGSQVDYAGHANDPVFMVTEFLAFDKAVGIAVDYAKEDSDTLVVILPDHDTGGLSIGNTSPAAQNYMSMPLEKLTSPLKNAKITIQGLLRLAYMDKQVTVNEIQDLFKAKWQLILDDRQAEDILELRKFRKFDYAVGDYISKNFTILGWTSGGHTGVDVPLWVYAGKGDNPFKGNIDNTQIAIELAKLMNIDLNMLKEELFVDAESVFPGCVLSKDDTGRILEAGDARVPVNKDIVIKDGREFRTEGITVYIPGINKVFIPKEAVEIIQSE
jgi:alkaline phosphatase